MKKITARKAPKSRKSPDVISSPQIIAGFPQGQMTSWFNQYVFRKVSGDFYEVLREGIPIIDAAIRRLISLNGTIKVIGDNMPLVKELEDFCMNVPVNDMQKGIHAFKENAENETFEQGFSISEFIATKKRDDIDSLRVADSKRIVFRLNADGRAEPWFRSGVPLLSNYTMPGTIIQTIINARYGQTISYNGVEEVKLVPDNKLYFSINNENSDSYGVSIMRSLEFVSQILVTIQNSIKSTAERFGDPSYHLHYSGKGNTEDLKARQKALQDDFNTTLNAKRQGKNADIVTASGPDSKVEIKVIGHDGQILTFEIQLRHLLEQIVSKTSLPAWMLGIYWSTTERMATLEIEAALADAKIRQLAMLPEYIRLFSMFLKLRGRTWKSITTALDKPGDWGIIFETPNLRDLVAQAQSRFLNSQADMMQSGASSTQTNVTVGGASVEIQGMKFPLVVAGKTETQRPIDWPELDKVETEYETALKDHWSELQAKVFLILKLEQPKEAKGDIPGLDSFQFTEDQRQQIMQALKDWIGTYSLDDANSPVYWYYGQAYSLGLIQAAKLIGKARPILDIIKNKEIYDELCKNGFQLVKDNATRVIQDKILTEMQVQMTAGSNPIHVADRLERLFGDANSDWERLARSEMSMAAENAKLDEWQQWNVKRVEFTPAPDACAICVALAGDYDISKAPVPVQDTHPRCRCSIRPAASEA